MRVAESKQMDDYISGMLTLQWGRNMRVAESAPPS